MGSWGWRTSHKCSRCCTSASCLWGSDQVCGRCEKELKLRPVMEALEAIRDFDAFQGGPIAPRETPTSTAMRDIARSALAALDDER